MNAEGMNEDQLLAIIADKSDHSWSEFADEIGRWAAADMPAVLALIDSLGVTNDEEAVAALAAVDDDYKWLICGAARLAIMEAMGRACAKGRDRDQGK